jgi:hypothetical protein
MRPLPQSAVFDAGSAMDIMTSLPRSGTFDRQCHGYETATAVLGSDAALRGVAPYDRYSFLAWAALEPSSFTSSCTAVSS